MNLNQRDLKKLLSMVGHINRTKSLDDKGAPQYFITYFPRDKKYAAKALEILKKYVPDSTARMSSLNNRAFPTVCMPITNEAREIMSQLHRHRAPAKKEALLRGRTDIMRRNSFQIWQSLRTLFTQNNRE